MADTPADAPAFDDMEGAKRLQEAYATVRKEIAKVIVGQDEVVEQLLVAIFARGHGLLVGVPGLAKTLLVSTLSRTLSLSFNRIQFTPDLMPADITGTEVIQEDRASGTREFKFLPGPVFAHVVLADEINRTPPKTQAALLEAMQENQVTAGGKKHTLPRPFFVLATQNPIEQEGTYPLPEAQLDRFMFLIRVQYPSAEEEMEIVRRTTGGEIPEVDVALTGEEILELQKIVSRVPVSDAVLSYALSLTRRSRVNSGEAPDFVKDWVSWGAGPRASQYLVQSARARALLQGRTHVSTDDIRAVAHPVLRHRILTNFSAEAEGVNSDIIITRLLDTVSAHPTPSLSDGRLPQVLGPEGP
ncbi:MAG: AAA family ATPase [Planctomycetota bacterium]|jgi:MoxR-like ATPase